MLEDKTITCRDCGGAFVFTAGEQAFYIEKSLYNDPQRCQDCRAARRREKERATSTVVCAECGGPAQVPFVPRLDRPVYCANCFQSRTAARAGRDPFLGGAAIPSFGGNGRVGAR